MFTNVKTVYSRDKATLQEVSQDSALGGVVLVESGKTVCSGSFEHCATFSRQFTETIDLQGGSLGPGLLTYGAPIGLVEIDAEASSNDGVAYAPLRESVPSLLGKEPLTRAADGLQFQGRDEL